MEGDLDRDGRQVPDPYFVLVRVNDCPSRVEERRGRWVRLYNPKGVKQANRLSYSSTFLAYGALRPFRFWRHHNTPDHFTRPVYAIKEGVVYQGSIKFSFAMAMERFPDEVAIIRERDCKNGREW